MRLQLFALAFALAATLCGAQNTAQEGAVQIVAKCNACNGDGKLVLTPPDHGQHRGAIEPKSHWDVRIACPACGGKGRLKVYRTSMPPLKDGPPPCTTCGWTGVERCRKCSGSGLVKCTATNCKGGWIVTKQSTTYSKHASSSYTKTKVSPCTECKGLGKVVCAECEGLRGTMCRKCNGLGRGKERK